VHTLREQLQDWTDWDHAMYRLGRSTGLFADSDVFATTLKHVFWTDNPVGVALVSFLDQLVAIGILLKRDEPDFQYRWNNDFQGSWMPKVQG
jgi:hypothetical protein